MNPGDVDLGFFVLMEKILDEVTIFVKAGNGGKGCDSHIRISEKKFMPTGGEGGKGGSVILRADENVTNLKGFLYKKHLAAESGEMGGSNKKKGRKGHDLMISVPCGTMIYDREKQFLIRDLVHSGDEVIVLEGGRGGNGNAGGKEAQPGEKGGELQITLRLKIPAEVFLVGLPNTGKSKFLNRITGSHAKEESYPFSTKHLELGTYETSDFGQIHLCELPAVYRESSQGRGVGVDFLKHLDRAKLILLMLEPLNRFASTLQEGYETLLEVLSHYQESFLEIPRAVVVNKMDLAEARERFDKEKFHPSCPLFLISTQTGEGVAALMQYVAQTVRGVNA